MGPKKMNNETFDIVVIGAGSAGMQYAFAAQAKGLKLAIVDPVEEKLDLARARLSGGAFFSRGIYQLSAIVFVIAVPAGHRTKILEDVLARDPKSVIVEKILGKSLAEVDWLEDISESSRPTFSTHIRWSLNKLEEELGALQKAQNLGRLSRISSFGSGMCAITGGWHWLAHVLELNKVQYFGGASVGGDFAPGPWTTRFGGSRKYFGQFRLSYQGKQLLSVDYRGEGSAGPLTILEYDNGRVLMTFDGEVGVFRSPDLADDDATRSQEFSFQDMTFRSLSLANPFAEALEHAFAGKEFGWKAGILATRLLLGLLGDAGGQLNDEQRHLQYFEGWPIT